MDLEAAAIRDLTETVAQLRKQVRWLQRIGIASAVIAVVGFLVYRHQRYRSVRGQEFVLTDEQGTTRAKLALFPEGAGLELFAASGEERVQLVGGGEDAQLNLYLPVTATRTAAAINFFQNTALTATWRANSSSASLELSPPADHDRASLALRRGRASLTFMGTETGSPQATLGIDAGNSCVVLDGTVAPVAKSELCLRSPGLPALELTDLSGKNLKLSPR